jgi:serine/threonine protein kinase
VGLNLATDERSARRPQRRRITPSTQSVTMLSPATSSGPGLPCSGLLAASTLQPGAVIGMERRFQLERVLGTGGSSIVFAAYDRRLTSKVAIKMLLPTFDERWQHSVSRLRREGLIIGGLNHEQVVRLLDTGEWRGLPYLVLEHVDGSSLATLTDRAPLDWRDALEIIRQLARCLAYLHERGVVHRDLKPSNVLLTAGGGLKVIDFGLAHVGRAEAGSLKPGGTPGYMAPEQWEGGAQDARTDIWAMAVMTFEMLTGRQPITASNTMALRSLVTGPQKVSLQAAGAFGVPPAVVTLLERALDKNPRLRHPNAAAFLLELNNVAPAAAAA